MLKFTLTIRNDVLFFENKGVTDVGAICNVTSTTAEDTGARDLKGYKELLWGV